MQDNSKCRKNFLCDFQLSRDLYDATIEVCRFCSKKVVYRKGEKGRVDNKQYLRDHIRSTVQPFGRTKKLFLKIYGNKPIGDLMNSLRGKKTKAEIEREWEEMRINLRRSAEKGEKIYR